MKWIKKFNEQKVDIESKLLYKWRGFISTMIDVFLEFSDSDWHWEDYKSTWPEFHCTMNKIENVYIPASEINFFIDYTGEIKNGKIFWKSKDLTNKKFEDIDSGKEFEEVEDFVVCIERLHYLTGVDFKFSYNNKKGSHRIIISGFISDKNIKNI